jgi:hypothetical protein
MLCHRHTKDKPSVIVFSSLSVSIFSSSSSSRYAGLEGLSNMESKQSWMPTMAGICSASRVLVQCLSCEISCSKRTSRRSTQVHCMTAPTTRITRCLRSRKANCKPPEESFVGDYTTRVSASLSLLHCQQIIKNFAARLPSRETMMRRKKVAEMFHRLFPALVRFSL